MEQVQVWGKVFYYEPEPEHIADSPWKPRTLLCQACGYGYEHYHYSNGRFHCNGTSALCSETHERTGIGFSQSINGGA